MIKRISPDEEAALESSITLEECQQRIKRLHDMDIGIHCFCESTGIQFFDRIHMSKYVITETCKKYCPYYKELIKTLDGCDINEKKVNQSTV